MTEQHLGRLAIGSLPRSDAFATLERALRAGPPATLRWTVCEAEDSGASVERLRLLAAAQDHAVLGALLRENGFHPIELAAWSRVPEASDWYGVHATDGTLLHVCLQRKLVLGSASDGWLPIDAVRAPPEAADANTARAMSLALALCERTLRGGIEASVAAPSELHRGAGLQTAFVALFGSRSAAQLLDAVAASDPAALRRRLSALAAARPASERMGERVRRARWRLAALNRRGPRLPVLARRERTGPAPVIAVIGSDGSGKSTVSRWLAETLDTAFGARFLYFGTGDGPGSPVRIALNGLKRRSRYGTATSPGEGSDPVSAPRKAADTAPTFIRVIWATVVGWERIGKMRALERARRAGFLVVTDRFPQNERGGIHDGPRLAYLIEGRDGGPIRALARLERAIYARLARRVPDRVLLLDVPLELALERRPEEPEAELARRIDVARSLRFGDATRTVVDASAALATVKARALRAALDALTCGGVPPES